MEVPESLPVFDTKLVGFFAGNQNDSNRWVLKRVVRTFLNAKDALVHVQVNGETIICIAEHPFHWKTD